MFPPPLTRARDFYVFKGWYNGNALWDFASDKVDGPLTLKARWEGVSFKVTFVDGVESTEDLVETVRGGTAVVKARRSGPRWIYVRRVGSWTRRARRPDFSAA